MGSSEQYGGQDLDTLMGLLVPYLGEPAGRIRATAKGAQAPWRCPFHKGGQEKRPSFYLNLSTGMAFCHTCRRGGRCPG
jgi:hypothetical protein